MEKQEKRRETERERARAPYRSESGALPSRHSPERRSPSSRRRKRSLLELSPSSPSTLPGLRRRLLSFVSFFCSSPDSAVVTLRPPSLAASVIRESAPSRREGSLRRRHRHGTEGYRGHAIHITLGLSRESEARPHEPHARLSRVCVITAALS